MPLIICLTISATILWFYRTKNPVKQFRPPFGELAVLGIVLFGVSGAASYFVYQTITESQEKIKAMKEVPAMLGPEGGGGNKGGGGSSVFEETLTEIEADRRAAARNQPPGEEE